MSSNFEPENGDYQALVEKLSAKSSAPAPKQSPQQDSARELNNQQAVSSQYPPYNYQGYNPHSPQPYNPHGYEGYTPPSPQEYTPNRTQSTPPHGYRPYTPPQGTQQPSTNTKAQSTGKTSIWKYLYKIFMIIAILFAVIIASLVYGFIKYFFMEGLNKLFSKIGDALGIDTMTGVLIFVGVIVVGLAISLIALYFDEKKKKAANKDKDKTKTMYDPPAKGGQKGSMNLKSKSHQRGSNRN